MIYIDVMPSANVTFHLDVADRTTKTIHYYVETLPGETPTRTYNGKGFIEYKSVDAQYTFFTEAEDYVDLVGFTKGGPGGTTYPPEAYNANGTKLNSVWNNSNARNVYCYYTRNVYSINFMDGVYVDGSDNGGIPITDQINQGQLGTANNIAYGGDVTSYNDYVPDEDHTPDGFVFEGWYIDDACSQKYTFDKMPEGGITVYAKWRIVQYRVFLHPNAPAGANADFLGGQSTSFRVDYNESIAKPKGYVDGYELVGWYLKYNDGVFSDPFDMEAYTVNDNTGTKPYDKSRSTELDEFGNPRNNTNADTQRFWITKCLDLYAKWRSTIEGAEGITVVYVVNSNETADPLFYKDKSSAVAAGAPDYAPEGQVFSHWVVQKWNGTEWVDDTSVDPGKDFDILKSNAQTIVTQWVNPNNENDVYDVPEAQQTPGNTTAPDPTHTKIKTATYTIRVIPVYLPVEEETPTFIWWFGNGNSQDLVRKDGDGADPYPVLKINQAVSIPTPNARTGYKFLGWFKLNTSAAEPAHTYDVSEPNFLWYDGSAYHKGSVTGAVATQVAADEAHPYDYLYAVWQPKLQVKITGNTDTKTYNGSEQSVTDFTVEYKLGDGDWMTTVPAGVSVSLKAGKEAVAKGTNVNTDPGYPMGLTEDDFTVTSTTYELDTAYDDNGYSYEDGWLKITPITDAVTVTIVGNNDSKVYNGNEQSVTGYTYSAKAGEATVANSEFVVALNEGKEARKTSRSLLRTTATSLLSTLTVT